MFTINEQSSLPVHMELSTVIIGVARMDQGIMSGAIVSATLPLRVLIKLALRKKFLAFSKCHLSDYQIKSEHLLKQ